MIQGTEEIGCAGIGAEISWGPSSLTSAATFLSDSTTFDGSGAEIAADGRCAGLVEHAVRQTNNSTDENRTQTCFR